MDNDVNNDIEQDKKPKYGRGKNPNSHRNKPKVNNQGVIPGEITLTEEHWQLAQDIGNGNKSAGIRHALESFKQLQEISI